MKVVDVLWFSPNILHFVGSIPLENRGSPFIGIVLVEFEAGDEGGEPGQRGGYLGSCFGKKEEADVQEILENGAKVHPVHVGALWLHFKGEIR